MSHREEWNRLGASLKGAQKGATADSAHGTLDLIPPLSGNPEDVAELPSLAIPEAAMPADVVKIAEGQALRDFQSSLTKSQYTSCLPS